MNKQTFRQCPGCKAEFLIQKDIELYQVVGTARYGVASPECGYIRAIDVLHATKESPMKLEDYTKLAERWAYSAWDAWKEHHETVTAWYEEFATK